jgi:hypothetical protein
MRERQNNRVVPAEAGTHTHRHRLLILRSRAKRGVSKDVASWFETRGLAALLTMRDGFSEAHP